MKRAVATVTALGGQATAEFVVATLPGVPLPSEAGGILLSHVVIDGFINYTPGTAATLVTVRVRRNSLVGTLVGVAQQVTVASGPAVVAIPVSADDPIVQTTPPTLPGQVYVVTLQQNITPAGTVNYAVITATTS